METGNVDYTHAFLTAARIIQVARTDDPTDQSDMDTLDPGEQVLLSTAAISRCLLAPSS